MKKWMIINGRPVGSQEVNRLSCHILFAKAIVFRAERDLTDHDPFQQIDAAEFLLSDWGETVMDAAEINPKAKLEELAVAISEALETQRGLLNNVGD